MDIYEEIAALKRAKKRGALATIVRVRGSIPSVAAAKMLVREDGSSAGTIGGGLVEAEVRRGAMEVMREEKPKSFAFELDRLPDDEPGLICGGSLEVFVEPLIPAPPLYIFGAGHVGQFLCQAATLAGFEVTVIDNRPEYASRERFPSANELHAIAMEDVTSRIHPCSTTFISIVTRGHRTDLEVLRWALGTEACYIGMIGSARKVRAVFQELESEGVRRETLDRVYAPIGLDIASRTPEEIAISIVAELVAVRRGCKVAPHLRDGSRQKPEKK